MFDLSVINPLRRNVEEPTSRCNPARLLWSKLGCLFAGLSLRNKNFLCAYLVWWLFSGEFILLFVVLYLRNNFPDSTTRFGEDSLLSHVVLDGGSKIREAVYFFNITNAEDFLERGAALNVKEVGPYVYRVWTEKKDRVWDDEQQTLSYNDVRRYDFHSRASHGNLNDEIITWNGPLIIVAENLKKSNSSFRQEFLPSFTNLTIFVKRKVKELVFGHYHDDLLLKASLAGLDVPREDGTFLWLDNHRKKRRVFTVSDRGIMKGFNGRDKLDIWNGDECNKINGTSGKIIGDPPLTSEHLHYSIFLPDLCRSLTLPRVKHDNVEWTYQPTKETLANSAENPNNCCFETRGRRPSGVYSLSCSGAPLWVSWPHFYLGDPSYSRNINGLNPNEKSHDSHLRVYRHSGFTIEMKLSTQINIELDEVCSIPPFNRIPRGIYPVLWSTVILAEKDLNWLQILNEDMQRRLANNLVVACLYITNFCMCLMAGKFIRRWNARKAERKEGNRVDLNSDGTAPPTHQSAQLELEIAAP